MEKRVIRSLIAEKQKEIMGIEFSDQLLIRYFNRIVFIVKIKIFVYIYSLH